jgi:hypothetical protein
MRVVNVLFTKSARCPVTGCVRITGLLVQHHQLIIAAHRTPEKHELDRAQVLARVLEVPAVLLDVAIEPLRLVVEEVAIVLRV